MRTNEGVLQALIEGGATRAFTLPGLGITWSLRAFHARRQEFDVVLTRSEQCASVMAQVTGKLTGRPGVFMGQGAFATTTGGFGILEAYYSGSPMVILTDTSCYDGFAQMGVYQTMTGDYGAGDAMAVLKTMTKFTTYATQPVEAVYGIQLALKHAALPRQGPAAVIMKTDIILKDLPEAPRARLYGTPGYLKFTPARPDPLAIGRLGEMIRAAKHPVIVAGNGVYMSGSGPKLQALAERLGIAVATSYHGKGVVDETCPIAVGMMGNWGARCANRMVGTADFVLMLGVSMGPEYTKFRSRSLIRPDEQTLAQIDVDPRNAGWVYPVQLAITGDVGDALDMLAALDLPAEGRETRLALIERIKAETDYGHIPEIPTISGTLHNADIVRTLQDFLGPDDLLTLDAGTNRIWATVALRLRHPNQLVAPGGLGGMGWSPPAATAAKLVHPAKRVTSVSGDGGFAMTMNAIPTAVDRGLDVVYVVANNKGLGMVRDNLGNQRIAVDYGEIDFAKVGEGMGAKGFTVTHRSELRDALEAAHKAGGPAVVDVKIDPAASHRDASDYDA
ncbi:MAG: thiamine pyrophosphate-binding protein [Alphaproteobacteria bacterium]|nr:thiamine pyrophosphate-binding protein [Alphaproteobacteria bacterium]